MACARGNRVRWRCRRGSLELDTILGNFFVHCYAGLSEVERDDFERLLAQPDYRLSEWLEHQVSPPEDLRNIVARII